ncbi:hypothetical protein ENBRE01_1001 [Enteropsectra breve]|nr:hypothetical protein ENBRE01_1001 [Enteropsectra breve]
MENAEKILELTNIDIVEYLNKIHTTEDYFLIETQKHDLEKYNKELDEQLHLSFISNSESLLEILNTYQYAHELLASTKIPRFVQTDDKMNINYTRCEELRKKCELFDDNMETFLTNERYLVKSARFNSKEYLCLLTNDILFVGKVKDDKYSLLHSFNKNSIEMKMKVSDKHSYLKIKSANGLKLKLKQKPAVVEEFYDAFMEVTYEFKLKNKAEKHNAKEDGLIRYLLETEQIEEMGKYIAASSKKNDSSKDSDKDAKNENTSSEKNEQRLVMDKLDCMKLSLTSIQDLKTAMRLFSSPEKIYFKFFSTRFRNGLGRINQIQEVSGLIKDIFAYLESFVSEIEEICRETGIPKINYLLIVEGLVDEIFVFVKNRIFNKFFELKISRENIDLIFSLLKFRNMDFSYMLETLIEERGVFAEKCLEKAKTQIANIVDSISN